MLQLLRVEARELQTSLHMVARGKDKLNAKKLHICVAGNMNYARKPYGFFTACRSTSLVTIYFVFVKEQAEYPK